jgi:hypothetical protein
MLNNVIFGLPLAAIAGGAILAQRGGITRTLPQWIEFPEFAPGGAAGRHTHPGIETGYVVVLRLRNSHPIAAPSLAHSGNEEIRSSQ